MFTTINSGKTVRKIDGVMSITQQGYIGSPVCLHATDWKSGKSTLVRVNHAEAVELRDFLNARYPA